MFGIAKPYWVAIGFEALGLILLFTSKPVERDRMGSDQETVYGVRMTVTFISIALGILVAGMAGFVELEVWQWVNTYSWVFFGVALILLVLGGLFVIIGKVEWELETEPREVARSMMKRGSQGVITGLWLAALTMPFKTSTPIAWTVLITATIIVVWKRNAFR